MDNKPYIGVTGFTHPDEVRDAVRAFEKCRHLTGNGYRLMVGVLANATTLYGGVCTRFPNRYPAMKDIAGILEAANGNVYRLIHYNVRNPEDVERDIGVMTERHFNHIDGFQLNMAFPPVGQLYRLNKEHGYDFVFQINSRVVAQCESPAALAKAALPYRGIAARALVDLSGGRGERMDIGQAAALALSVWGIFEGNVGVAGGLHGGNLQDTVGHLIGNYGFRGLSFDCEGKVRDEDDRLDMSKVSGYIVMAEEVVAKAHEAKPSGKAWLSWA